MLKCLRSNFLQFPFQHPIIYGHGAGPSKLEKVETAGIVFQIFNNKNSFVFVWRDTGVSLKGWISGLPEYQCWLYTLISLQQHFPRGWKFFNSNIVLARPNIWTFSWSTPSVLNSSTSPEGFIHRKTGWAQDACLQ